MEYQLTSKPERFFLRWERRAARMLFEQWQKVAAAYPVAGIAAVDVAFQNKEVETYLNELYNSIGGTMARETFAGINKAVRKNNIIDFAIQRILFYLQQFALTKVTSIQGTAIETMRQAIAVMIEQGLNSTEIARALVRAGRIESRKQAIVIARTEAVAAYNFGAMLGAEATGMATHKTWRAANQRRTRPDHRSANGQTVGFNETFTVGGSQMRYPGDPSAPAKQVVNCRCTMKFTLKQP